MREKTVTVFETNCTEETKFKEGSFEILFLKLSFFKIELNKKNGQDNFLFSFQNYKKIANVIFSFRKISNSKLNTFIVKSALPLIDTILLNSEVNKMFVIF